MARVQLQVLVSEFFEVPKECEALFGARTQRRTNATFENNCT